MTRNSRYSEGGVRLLIRAALAGLALSACGVWAEMPVKPGLDEIRNEEEERLLFLYVVSLIGEATTDSYDHAAYTILTENVNRPSGYYYLIESFEGLFGNGGAQAVLITDVDDLELFEWQLKRLAEGYRFFGATAVPTFLDKWTSRILVWNQKIIDLNDRERESGENLEHLYEPVWAEFDGLEEALADAISRDYYKKNYYPQMKQTPELFLDSSGSMAGIGASVVPAGVQWGQLILSFLVSWYGIFSIFIRLKRPGLFWKLGPMKERFGNTAGTLIHVTAYTLFPLVYGVYLEWH